MKIDIDELSEKELIELNHRIVERLKFLESARRHKNRMDFNIGERVSFSPAGREKNGRNDYSNTQIFYHHLILIPVKLWVPFDRLTTFCCDVTRGL